MYFAHLFLEALIFLNEFENFMYCKYHILFFSCEPEEVFTSG